MSRTAIAARVLVEERWIHVARRETRDWHELAARAALPIDRGGLGRPVPPATLRARSRSYDDRLRARIAEAIEDEAERRVALAEQAVLDADARLGAVPLDDLDGYAAAVRRYDRAEERLARVEAGEGRPVRASRDVRDGVEMDVALDVLRLLETFPEADRPHLRLSLDLEAPLARLAAIIARR